MFMRYRGGGIGHKYMRAIEELYENMSRERIHYKERKRKHTQPDKDTPMDDNDSDNGDDKTEGEAPGSQASRDTHETSATTAANTNGASNLMGDTPGDDKHSDDDDDDDDDILESDSRSSGISDSDDLDSNESCGGYESYGLGDP